MPKLYFEEDHWVVPGQQTRAAVRHDIPSTTAEPADWLNHRGAKPGGKPQGPMFSDAATAPRDHDGSEQAMGTIDPASVTDWIFDQATPAQVETVRCAWHPLS
ncbi:MAG: hypothetical protein IPN84_17760 [Sphingomonadales bacterium]|nr:hypothetical protein [Sphingomonadales bacterium]